MSTKCHTSSTQVMASFARNMHAVDMDEGVVQLPPVFLIPALDRSPAVGHLAVLCMNPLHRWGDRQQIESSIVLMLRRSIRHTAGREERGADLAGVDRMLEDCGAYEYWGNMVGVVEGRGTCFMDGRERHVGSQGDAVAGRRGLVVRSMVGFKVHLMVRFMVHFTMRFMMAFMMVLMNWRMRHMTHSMTAGVLMLVVLVF